MTCTIIGAVAVSCFVTGPKPSPAEAARILTASVPPFVYVPPSPRQLGPFFASIASTRPTAGPWAWPEPSPARRLDGTLLTDPPTIYGLPPWYRYSYRREHKMLFLGFQP